MELTQKINFKQPKYILPALVYFPLLFTGYFVIDMLHTKKADIADPSMQQTEYLNPNLPQPKVKDDLEGKYESMLKSYGIPCLRMERAEGSLGRVVLGISGYGVEIYVPENLLEDAKTLIEDSGNEP